MKLLLLLLLIFSSIFVSAQRDAQTCFEKNIQTGKPTDIDSLTAALINELPKTDFYLIGEAHTFLANNDFQFSLIRTLNNFGVYNVVNELPHATCFIFNQYLETGNNALLTSIKPAANYSLLKKVREYNLLQPIEQRIKYYGIDYLNPKYDYDNFYNSLQIIRELIPSKNLPLDNFIDKYLLKKQFQTEDVQTINDTLFSILQSDSLLYQKHFGRYFDDLLLMSDNMVGNRTNRDKDIFKSFLLLHKMLVKNTRTTPKFLSFYGIGHLNNLGNILLSNKESPVLNSVSKIGLQYFNCLGGWSTATYRDDGLYNLKKKKYKALKDYCKPGKWEIGILTNNDCIEFKGDTQLDAIVIFNNYGDRKMNSWKFD